MVASRARRLAGVVAGPDSKLSLAAGASLLVAAFGTVGRYVLQVVLAQLLGPAGFGLYLTLRRWGELLSMLPNRGHHGTVLRFLPDYVEGERWSLYRGLNRFAVGTTMAGATALWIIATVVGVLAWEDDRVAVVLAMLTIPAWAGFRMMQAILRARHQYVVSSVVDQLLQPGVMGLLLGLAWAAGLVLGLDLVMATLLVSAAAAAGLATFIARASTPGSLRADATAVTPERDLAHWRPAARSFFTGQMASAALNSADLLILAMFAPRAEVGLYGVATRIALLARVVNTGVDSIVAPRIAASWAARNMGRLQRNVDKALTVSIIPTVLIVVAIVAFRGPVLGIMGDEYRAAGDVMVVLMIGIFVQALTGPCGNVVALTNNEDFNAWTMTGAAVFLVVGSFVAAPLGGMMAVAIVTTTANTLWNLVLTAFAQRRLGIRCYPRPELVRSLERPEWARRRR